MKVSSLRPERGASANSATSAYVVRVVFYLKRVFCQLAGRIFSPDIVGEQILSFQRLLSNPFIIVLSFHYSTDRGYIFWSQKLLYCVSTERRVAHVCIRSRRLHFALHPRWLKPVRRSVRFRRTKQHGSRREMTDDHPIP